MIKPNPRKNLFSEDVSDEAFIRNYDLNYDDDDNEVILKKKETVQIFDDEPRINRVEYKLKPPPEKSDHIKSLFIDNDFIPEPVSIQQDDKKYLYQPDSVDETIRSILTLQPYTLDFYKSKVNKENLVKAAEKTGDGGVIITVTLFLKNTLSWELFIEFMKKYPMSAKHYLSYLKSMNFYIDLINYYKVTNQVSERMMLEYKLALTASSNLTVRNTNLLKVSRTNSHPGLEHIRSMMEEHINLIEEQRVIQKFDPKFPTNPEKKRTSIEKLEDSSVQSTIKYCIKHFGSKATSNRGLIMRCSNPDSHDVVDVEIKIQRIRLNDQEFLTSLFAGSSERGDWRATSELLASKAFTGRKTLSAVVGYENVVTILHHNQAPAPMIQEYLKSISNKDHAFSLARSYDYKKVCIDLLVMKKDKDGLIKYLENLNNSSDEFHYGVNCLEQLTQKSSGLLGFFKR